MAVISGFEPFRGVHCETNTTGNLLQAAGLRLSEPMLFGLGQALAYGVFTFKSAPGPFIGGRSRPDHLTPVLADALGFTVDRRESRSPRRAWANVTEFVDAGRPVGVKLNMGLLDYVTDRVDFAAHYVPVYGYDDERVFVVDTGDLGPQTTSRASFEAARLWRGPMASNALSWSVAGVPSEVDWPVVLPRAITANAAAYLTPPIKNFGAAGIRKTARLVESWADAYPAAELATLGMLMERGGTGGGLFRSMYARFLREANEHLGDERLADAAASFEVAAAHWTAIAAHLEAVGTDGPGGLSRARTLLLDVADVEEQAMNLLAGMASGGRP